MQSGLANSVLLPHFPTSDLPVAELLDVQGTIIDLMASGASLRETLTHIATLVESLAPPALCSILLLQSDGRRLRPAAAPSLPEPFTRAVDGLEIGPCVGSCGTAAYRKEPVIVSDIATDPLWEPARDFTLSFGLRACWSMPIIRRDGTVLGTIAMYYREVRAPTGRDFGLLDPASRLVRLALAQNRKEEELRESEARWTLAAEATGIGTFDIDVATNRDVWSPQFKAILGLDPAIDASPQLFSRLIHPEDRERFRSRFKPRPGPMGDFKRDEEFRILRTSDGAERIVILKSRSIQNSEGVTTRIIGTMADITEQREQEAALTEAKIMAERANRAKSSFLASMSHELRTPLNAVMGFSDVIRQQTFGPIMPVKYREYIDDIYDSGLHLLSLINDVLDMAKIEAGKHELKLTVVDLHAIVANALRFIEPQATAAKLILESHISDGAALFADERSILQILTNLLSNSIKFTPVGGKVTVFADPLSDGCLSLGVRDNGKGMTEEGLKRALEPFGQVEPTITSEGRGTGLGLPIVKALIEAHGAAFHIDSAPSKGTSVWGAFPKGLVIDRHAQDKTPAPAAAAR
jgi:PAS domain S-box-containing protein